MKTTFRKFFRTQWVPILTLILSAGVFGAEPESRQYQGKPVYLVAEFHENDGCPINSICDRETGEFRKKWVEFLQKLEKGNKGNKVAALEEYRRQFGLPSGLWVENKPQIRGPGKSPILWDSPCPHHQHKNGEAFFLLGEAFIKETREGKAKTFIRGKPAEFPLTGGGIAFDPVLVQDEKAPQKIQTFFVPQGEAPLYLHNSNIQMIRDAEGLYYLLQISTSGDWKVLSVPEKGEFPSEVTCPADLSKYFLDKLNVSRVFSSFYCKKMTDRKTKKVHIMLVPLSC